MQGRLPLHLVSSHNKHWMKFILQVLAVESLAHQQKEIKSVSWHIPSGDFFYPLNQQKRWINKKELKQVSLLPHANLSFSPSSENFSLDLSRIVSTWVTICFCFILTVQTRITVALGCRRTQNHLCFYYYCRIHDILY